MTGVPARVLQGVRIAVVAAILAAMAQFVSAHWDEISRQSVRVDVVRLTIASACLAGSFLIVAAWWGGFVRRLGVEIPLARAMAVWVRSAPTKYLPGGVGLLVYRVVWLRRQAVDPERMAVLMVFEQGYPLLCAAWFGSLALLLSGRFSELWQLAGLLAMLIPVMVCVAWPAPLVRLIRAVRRFMSARAGEGESTPRESLRITAVDVGRAAAAYMAYWAVVGVAFHAFLRAVQPDIAPPLLFSAASFSLAFVVGFVTVFAPNGLGVREACLAWLLGQVYDMPVAVWVSLMSRVWIMATEAVCACAASLILGRQERRR